MVNIEVLRHGFVNLDSIIRHDLPFFVKYKKRSSFSCNYQIVRCRRSNR